jgi:hypothetical protein
MYRWFVTGLAALAGSMTIALAQQPEIPLMSDNGPRLADLMEGTQSRHSKLWFAGKAGNWNLAAYEIKQIQSRLEDAATLYLGLPVTDLTTMAGPLRAAAEAVKAKDGKRFDVAFDEVTRACNACHDASNRAYIIIKRPTAPPFSNQTFDVNKK